MKEKDERLSGKRGRRRLDLGRASNSSADDTGRRIIERSYIKV